MNGKIKYLRGRTVKKIGGLMAALLLGQVLTANAATPGQIEAEGKTVRAEMKIENGRVMLPLRAVADSIGASVAWDYRTRTATFSKWAQSFTLTAGKDTADSSGYPRRGKLKLDARALLENGRVYVPLRFVAQAFGYKVTAAERTVRIEAPFAPEQRLLLQAGELAEARSFAIRRAGLQAQYARNPLVTTDQFEGSSNTFLFPEGEAGRFYSIFNGVVSFYELKSGFFVVTWQALVPLASSDKGDLAAFLAGEIKNPTGPLPLGTRRAFFSFREGEIVNISTRTWQSVAADGTVTQLGYKQSQDGQVLQRQGSEAFTLPGEKRG